MNNHEEREKVKAQRGKRLVIWLMALAWIALGREGVALAQQGKGALLITEVMYTTTGPDEAEEWVELANVGQEVIDLAGYKVGDEESVGGREGMQRFPAEGAWLEPGQVIIVARTAAGFQARWGFAPAYEMIDSDPAVPDMRPFSLWASGETALSNSGDEVLVMNPDGVIIDAMNYGESNAFFIPAVAGVGDGESVERVPANCDTDSAGDWQPQRTPTPGVISLEGECREALDPITAGDFPPIGHIQGDGNVSNFVNEVVTFTGVVTGRHEDRNTAGVTFYTLFVQDIPGREDGDPATSDAIAAFVARDKPQAQIGDYVVVSGQVIEFFDLTEISDENITVRVVSSGNPLPEPVVIDPPATDEAGLLAYYESLESMRVTLGDQPARVVGPTFSGCGFAVVRADTGLQRVVRQREEDPIGQIIPILNNSDVNCETFPHVKTGDDVLGLDGPLTYNFDQFKIVEQNPADLVVNAAPYPPLPTVPIPAAHQFSIISFNVENLFDGINDTGLDAEPKLTPEELALKQGKISAAIANLLHCPTLVGIQEVEKESLLLDLAAIMTDPCGFTYTVTHLESADSRGIDLALLSDPRRVSVQSATLEQTCTLQDTGIEDNTADCGLAKSPLFSRPPLRVNLTLDSQPMTIYINHFKSKRGDALGTLGERLEQAQHVEALVAEQLATDPDAWIIVMGDMNDYEDSPPLRILTQSGILSNILSLVPEAERYSYVFSGASQLIDALLVTPALQAGLASVMIVHTNADYPDVLGDDLNSPYKATDHDIPYAIFDLTDAPAETVNVVETVGEEPAPTPTTGGGNYLAVVGVGAAAAAGVGLYAWRRRAAKETT